MRTGLLGIVVVVVLAVAGPAGAGCWATVGVSTPPVGLPAGDTWTAELTILQHGRVPLPAEVDAEPTVTIVNTDTGETRSFAARSEDPAAGTYTAQVVFPSGGTWTYQVYDGFDNWNGEPVGCAKTHTFETVEVDGAVGRAGSGGLGSGGGSGFPAWPVGSGVAGALLAAFAVGLVVRRRGPRSVST